MRRGFAGTIEEHSNSLPYVLRALERHLDDAERHFQAGRCKMGFPYAAEAFQKFGEAQVHSKGMTYAEERTYSNRMIRVAQRVNKLHEATIRCLGR